MEIPVGFGARRAFAFVRRLGFRVTLTIAWTALASGAIFLVIQRASKPVSSLPVLAVSDVNGASEAGRIDQVSGDVEVKGTHGIRRNVASQSEGFPIGASFVLRSSSKAAMITEGNWRVELEGDGHFTLDDARRNSEGTRYAESWSVTDGSFSARPRDYDPAEHWMQVRTPRARIILRDADVGLRVTESGGEIWILSGRGTVFWNDGRTKELHARGMEYL